MVKSKNSGKKYTTDKNKGRTGGHSAKAAPRFNRKGKAGLQKLVSGSISIQRQGIGFVQTDSKKADDIYVHQSALNGAWHGDKVQVEILPGQRGKNREGRVVKILERSHRELAAEILPQQVAEEGHVLHLCKPVDVRLGGYILADCQQLVDDPLVGDVILVSLLPQNKQPADGVPRATALAHFGRHDSLPMYERMIKTNYSIHTEFPPEVLEECIGFPADPDPVVVLATDAVFYQGDSSSSKPSRTIPRQDLRHIGFVTIDGADARDFDDAIYVEKAGSGFVLWVGIADVAHYVRTNSALDLEARRRGNSYYFPASVEPMLPQALSNGLCSLKPGQPRLAMVARINFSKQGKPGEADFFPALIESRARLTYDDVHAALELGDQEAEERLYGQRPMLDTACRLGRLLAEQRLQRGTLEFELPEPQAVISEDGQISKLVFRKSNFSHQLIEEFMIAANEAVARYLATFSGLSFLYRTHEAPDDDKLRDLTKLLERSGLAARLPKNPAPKDLQQLLDKSKDKPEEFIVNRLLLRSLMQAKYTPAPGMHFGLASDAYCHFTSPIRRYADLTVHRALRFSLGLQEKVLSSGQLEDLADDLNVAERNAVAAERDIHKICAAMFMDNHKGEAFTGVVSGISNFGLYVELLEWPVEGFIRINSLPDDYYLADQEAQMLIGQRMGRIYRLGQQLELVLEEVNVSRLEIEFILAGEQAGAARAGSFKGGKKPGSKAGRSGDSRKKFQAGAVRVRAKKK